MRLSNKRVWLSNKRLHGVGIAALVLVTLGLAYLATLAPSITWANSGADSGDLVTAAATLGVAHPTGYPTYLLLAHLFQLLPLGDLAFRTNLLSVVAAVSAALCVYAIVWNLLALPVWRVSLAAGLAALGLGLSPVFWSQAVVAEVHSLNALFVGCILLFTLLATRCASATAGWPGRFQALIVGLALGNHVTVAFPAAVWLVAVGLRAPGPLRLRLLGRQLAWVAAGLLVYLYLPLRAAAHPPVNWGDPYNLTGFWWTVSGQLYRKLAFGLPTVFLYGRVGAWAALLAQQFGWIGLALGFVGLLYGAANDRLFVWLTAVVALALSVFAVLYDTADSYAYMIPAYLIFAIWIGLGVSVVVEAGTRRLPRAAPLIAALLAGALLWPALATLHQVDASRDNRATTYAASVLAAAPVNALVITSSDRDTFPLWYYHYALAKRRDIVVIVNPLLEFAWYRANLRAVYPTLQVPESDGTPSVETIAAANRGLSQVCWTDPDGEQVIACAAVKRET